MDSNMSNIGSNATESKVIPFGTRQLSCFHGNKQDHHIEPHILRLDREEDREDVAVLIIDNLKKRLATKLVKLQYARADRIYYNLTWKF